MVDRLMKGKLNRLLFLLGAGLRVIWVGISVVAVVDRVIRFSADSFGVRP